MQFILLAALLASAHASSVTIYSDAACKKKIQTFSFNNQANYQCFDFPKSNAKGAIFSKDIASHGFNVWDSQYCAGDMAGSVPTLGSCLSAADYGLLSWASAHISPRNTASQQK